MKCVLEMVDRHYLIRVNVLCAFQHLSGQAHIEWIDSRANILRQYVFLAFVEVVPPLF